MGDRWSEEVRPGDAPKDLAFGAGRDAGAEERGRSAIDCAVTTTGHLVQRTKSEASARESRIHLGDSEGKNRFGAPASTFDPFDLRAQ